MGEDYRHTYERGRLSGQRVFLDLREKKSYNRPLGSMGSRS